MDDNDYIADAHNQIFNDEYCKPLEDPVYLNTIDEINSFLMNHCLMDVYITSRSNV